MGIASTSPPAEAVARIRSGMRIFVHGAAATPTALLEALTARRDLENVTLYHLHTAGPAPFVDPVHAGRFRSVSFFVGAPVRAGGRRGPRRLHPDFPFANPQPLLDGRIALDAALRSRSRRPTATACCTLGTSVDAARAAVDNARIVIAEINDRMPRTHGATTCPSIACTRSSGRAAPLHEHPRQS